MYAILLNGLGGVFDDAVDLEEPFALTSTIPHHEIMLGGQNTTTPPWILKLVFLHDLRIYGKDIISSRPIYGTRIFFKLDDELDLAYFKLALPTCYQIQAIIHIHDGDTFFKKYMEFKNSIQGWEHERQTQMNLKFWTSDRMHHFQRIL